MERLAFDGSLRDTSLAAYKPSVPSKNDVDMLKRVRSLIDTVDEHDVIRRRVTPPDHPFWAAAKREKFFGLIVPDEYGGKQLTPSGLSHVLQSLASVSASVPVHVMVPASLGPAELLVHYGTPAQRRHFLPRLAKGAIPCFGLTSLDAGSDAAGSMTDTGTAFRRADGTIGIRLECRKRYITLAPVADIVGMAFRLQDPEGLLESVCDRRVDGQITLALLERDTPNLEIGTYTDPLGVGFANGFVDALGVEIEVDDVIGGAAGLGEGWKFLMEALAAGRGIALPAGAAGSSKMLCNAVAGYAVVRRQFKTSISDFEGVQEKLADMAMKTYEIDSLVALMNCMLDDGERPPIMSAILKQRTTELGRDVVMHAMDIVAGSAICMGPQNFVAPAYLSSPIGITVEGSNTMTRSLLIFGQGLVRSHPHLLALIRSIETGDEGAFAKLVRTLVLDNLALAARPTIHLSPLERYVVFFALSSNASLVLGGDLKRREFLSGRYADLLSFLVAGVAMRWHARTVGLDLGTSRIVEACEAMNARRLDACVREIVENHPHSALHRLILWKTVGSCGGGVTDAMRAAVSTEVCTPDSALRQLFDRHVLVDAHPNVKRIREALHERDAETLDALRAQILRVDSYVCSTTDARLELSS